MSRFSNSIISFVSGLFLVACHQVGGVEQTVVPQRNAADQWVTPVISAPQTRHYTFISVATKSKVSYHLFTPRIYALEKERRFPVLYWLHGSGGGLKGIPHLARLFDQAMRAESMPPMIIVFVNGMSQSMWVDSKDGSVPMETVVVKELLPHIDASFRTRPSRQCRLIEGFSMGGYGAARLAFKYHRTFGAVSMLGAGPLQRVFTPSLGPKDAAQARARVLEKVYGSDQAYFRMLSPWVLVEQQASAISATMLVRQVIGENDDLLVFNRDFDAHLTELGIPHSFTVLPDVAHRTMAVFKSLGEANWKFYRAFFNGCHAG